MLPALTRTWNISPNNRVPYSSVQEVTRRELLGVKNHWFASGAVQVVGSSNGVVGDMDNQDRWELESDVDWIVLRAPMMGNVQILLEKTAQGAKVAIAPSYQFISNKPWSASELVLSDDQFDVGDARGDRLWSAGYATDGTAFWCFLARGRSIHRCVLLQICSSSVEAPSTFDPAVVGFSLDNRGLEASSFSKRPLGRAIVNGIACPLFIGGESYGGSPLAADAQPGVSDLQGGYIVQPLSLWSETLGARGKVGDLIDVWAGTPSLADGDLLPDDGTKQMIAVGQLILPWDGTTDPVMV
jgi:hypothetical protein